MIKNLLQITYTSFIIILGYTLYDNFPDIYKKYVPYLDAEKIIQLHDDYYNFAPQKQLIKSYKKAAFFKRIVPFQSEFWLLYISLLVNFSEDYKARYILWRYIRNISNLNDLYRFLHICNFAVEHGNMHPEIKKSAQIFQALEASRHKQTLFNLLKGKKVAVIGNGPFEVGKKSGQEIDAHDIVIRMNNYIIDGYEEDYGTRTDVWIYGFGGADIEDKTLNHDYLYVGITGDYTYIPLFFDFQRDRLYRDMFERKINIGTVDPDSFKELHFKYNLDPSTGLQIIYTLKNWGIDFDVYGFAFLDSKTNKDHYNIHYYKNDDEEVAFKRASWHNHDKEFELLSSWFSGRHIKK